ncbi:MAG: sugar transferase [Phycisphaeraceae bacterium]|nr:sugar transferase [Phycisphaeraceae bacterium]
MTASITHPLAPPQARPDPVRSSPVAAPVHTVWGLDPMQLHTRFWASRGIQVVRQGEPSAIVPHAELYLLADPRTLTIFRTASIVEQIAWLNADLMFVRITDSRSRGYREFIVMDEDDRFVRFTRDYGSSDSRLARIALTPDRDIARIWQAAKDPRSGWQRLRYAINKKERWTMSAKGRVYDKQSDAEVAAFVRDLVTAWRRPDSTIHNIREVAPRVWAASGDAPDASVRFTGPVWIGAGRKLEPAASAVGPAVLWDAPEARPIPEEIRWLDLEPTDAPTFGSVKKRQSNFVGDLVKRSFDIAFSLVALALTLPLYPFIMLAIFLENPGPIFFVHRRESRGGKEFGCIKFRSMRTDAEEIKKKLLAENKNLADGPQFFMDPDPRLTKVGAFIRKCQIDELPQFWNVLFGHMSVVGPRPSPRSENQCCPPWREARLSVLPGITGLWQIKRTRAKGADFQEWIKYDIEYVERANLWLDLYIIWKTIQLAVRGILKS